MVNSFFNQYRRIALCTLLGLAALLQFLFFSPAASAYAHLFSPMGVAVMTALALAFSCLIVALLVLPGAFYLEMAECIMLSVFVLCVVAVALPKLILPGWALGLTLLLLPCAIDWAIYGDHWKWTKRDFAPRRPDFFTSASPEIVWRRLYPDPAHIVDYLHGGATISALPAGVLGDFLLKYPSRAVKGGVEDLVVRRENVQIQKHFRVLYSSFGGPPGPWNPSPVSELEISEEYTIQPLAGGGTWVTFEATFHRLHLPGRFKWWLSNSAAEMSLSLTARIEGRRDRTLWGRYTEPASVLQS